MKIKLFPAVFALFVVSNLAAQSQVEITPMAGYVFRSRFDLYGGYGEFEDAAVYGGAIGVKLAHQSCIELLYTHEATEGSYQYYYDYSDYFANNIPVGINYLQLGINKVQELGEESKAEVFGGVNLGAAWVVPEDKDGVNYSTKTMFAFGLNLGTKLWLSEKIGIRLQSNMQVPIQNLGFGIFAGSGGTSTGVTAYSSIVQFGFTGGIIIRMPEKE